MTNPIDYYATHGPITAPHRFGVLLDGLPTDVAALAQLVQGLIIHVFWAGRYGAQLDEARREEVQLRAVEKQLERIITLDPRPLTDARAPESKLVGNCRDFTTLLTAILRHQGMPARARCGFGRYFEPDHYEDHWVAEYWNADEGRWVLVDAQMDELQRGALDLPFDPLDVPRDQFITGGRAWQMARAGEADPETFGIHDMHGLWFIRGNLVRDVAALNKVELLPWDVWGLAYVEGGDEVVGANDLAALDEMAALSGGDVPAFDRLRSLYETDERWRVPSIIRSFTPAGPVEVTLPMEKDTA
jgi:hypothetical protein